MCQKLWLKLHESNHKDDLSNTYVMNVFQIFLKAWQGGNTICQFSIYQFLCYMYVNDGDTWEQTWCSQHLQVRAPTYFTNNYFMN